MFRTSATTPLDQRTVGVLSREDGKLQQGFMVLNSGRETYLIDEDGRVVHEWRAKRNVFVAYLRRNGNLVRDGSEEDAQAVFRAGCASGYFEEVTWDGELLWRFSRLPAIGFLTHHDIEVLDNGNVMLLCWERKTKEEAIAAGRRPELVPDGEVWNNLTIEIKPSPREPGSAAPVGGAEVVWQWSMWDHLVQDYDPDKANYRGLDGVHGHPELFDINFCPPGGGPAQRNRDRLRDIDKSGPSMQPGSGMSGNSHGLSLLPPRGPVVTGDKDWLHVNAVSLCARRDLLVMSLNVPCEIIIVDHATTAEEAATHAGGRRGKGGDIIWRWGNPQIYHHGARIEQTLFVQHSSNFVPEDCPGAGNIILFNNGRNPDRVWSEVLELRPLIPGMDGGVDGSVAPAERAEGEAFGAEIVFQYGPRAGRAGSFYCTHISGCMRMANGNTLITIGTLGTVVEVTPDGEEVWRWLSPVMVRRRPVRSVTVAHTLFESHTIYIRLD